jgi:signal transduction histidine kinase
VEELLTLLAHELRTPLQIALGLQEQLEDAVAGSGRVGHLLVGELAGTYGRLAHAIEAVIEAGRLVSADAGRRTEPVCLATVLHDAVGLVDALASERGVTIHRQLPAVVPTVRADEACLGQVLVGLLTRAVTHVPAGAEVRVRSFGLPGRLGLAIEASEPWSGRPASDASGALSLFTSKRLVEVLGGRFGLHQQAGSPVVWFTLPVDA